MTHPLHDRRYPFVAKLLTEIRKDRGLLQQDVADGLNRPQGFVSKYESGGRRLDLIELLDILRVLDADPHAFIDRVQAQSMSAQSMSALPRWTNAKLDAIDLETKRKIVLGLVKRVEIHKDEIVVVFRIDPQPPKLAKVPDLQLLARHLHGDWGDQSERDRLQNTLAVLLGMRIPLALRAADRPGHLDHYRSQSLCHDDVAR